MFTTVAYAQAKQTMILAGSFLVPGFLILSERTGMKRHKLPLNCAVASCPTRPRHWEAPAKCYDSADDRNRRSTAAR